MFITLTIDTHQNQKAKVRLHKRNVNPAAGWQRAVNVKKRNLFQKIKAWRRHARVGAYKLDGQAIMF